MNSELEKLIEKYRITVNGLADLESDYEKVIKERGFVTLNGLLAATDSPSESAAVENSDAHSTENPSDPSENPSDPSETVNTPNPEPTPVVPAPGTVTTPNPESTEVHNPEPTPVVPGSETAAGAETAPVENPGVTPVSSEPAVSDDTNLGTEVAASSTDGTAADAEDSTEEDTASTEDNSEGTPRKPKKKKN